MKKIIAILVILSVSIFSLMAQNSRHETGNISINAGVGIPYTFNYLTVPPLKVDADYTFLTFGSGAFSLAAGVYGSLAGYRSFSHLLVGAMFNFRFAISDSIDLFSKTIVGYKHMGSYGRFGAGEYIGATWYFSPYMGVGAEIGYGGPTLLGVHMAFKF